MDSHEITTLQKRLNVVIALLLQMVPKNAQSSSIRDQIAFLASLGLRPVEIAEILGKKDNYVNKELVSIRKPKVKKL